FGSMVMVSMAFSKKREVAGEREMDMLVRRAAALALVVIGSGVFSGCAAWKDHNETTKESRNAFEEGRFDEALASSDADVDNKLDGLCFQFDRGVIAQVGGKYERSITELERAEKTIEDF